MGLLLASSTSIAIQGSAVVLYEESQEALYACCCETGCDCLGVAVAVPIGSDWEVELSGIEDQDCDDCASSLNGVHTFLDVARVGCGTDESMIVGTTCDDSAEYSVSLKIDYPGAGPMQITVLATATDGAFIRSQFVFDEVSCDQFADLLAGEWVEIPFDAGSSAFDDIFSPCTYTTTPTCRVRRI